MPEQDRSEDHWRCSHPVIPGAIGVQPSLVNGRKDGKDHDQENDETNKPHRTKRAIGGGNLWMSGGAIPFPVSQAEVIPIYLIQGLEKVRCASPEVPGGIRIV